jgi:hypothetical protein
VFVAKPAGQFQSATFHSRVVGQLVACILYTFASCIMRHASSSLLALLVLLLAVVQCSATWQSSCQGQIDACRKTANCTRCAQAVPDIEKRANELAKEQSCLPTVNEIIAQLNQTRCSFEPNSTATKGTAYYTCAWPLKQRLC